MLCLCVYVCVYATILFCYMLTVPCMCVCVCVCVLCTVHVLCARNFNKLFNGVDSIKLCTGPLHCMLCTCISV